MNYRALLFCVCTVMATAGCTTNLTQDVYSHAREGDEKDKATAFIALSKMALPMDALETIQNDYQQTNDSLTQFYYEFLLAKRTQEPKYVDAFIRSCADQLPHLATNETQWVSITSPFYEDLALYSRTNDAALNVLFQLAEMADGATLAAVAADLSDIESRDPKRFAAVATSAGADVQEIRSLMEEE